jgi:hypothetical protein
MLGQLVAALRATTPDAERVSALCEDLYARFKGLTANASLDATPATSPLPRSWHWLSSRHGTGRQQPLRLKDARGVGPIEDHVEVRLTRVVGKFVDRVDEVRRDLVAVLEDQQFCRFLEQADELVAVLA